MKILTSENLTGITKCPIRIIFLEALLYYERDHLGQFSQQNNRES